MYLTPSLIGFPWNWVTVVGLKKTRMVGYRAEKELLTISLAVWLQGTNVTDRRTDTVLSIAPS